MPDETTSATPIAWTAIPPKTPLRCDDGHEIGRVVTVLGSRDEDIFHGLVVEIDGRRRVVQADEVALITEAYVDADLSCDELRALPDDEGAGSFHAGRGGGLLGTRVNEKETFKPDEPGQS